MELIDVTYRAAEKYPRNLMMCTTVADIRRAKTLGKVCALMGIEGGYAIENDLSALREFYRLGVRYMTLTHNVTHDWADAHNDTPKNNGLSPFGKQVVRKMNELGMMVDISHVSDRTFFNALTISRAPVIASHSSSRALTDHARNMTDDMLRAMKDNGGVVMVNFYSVFIDDDYRKAYAAQAAERNAAIKALREKLV